MLLQFYKEKKLTTLPSYGQFIDFLLFNTLPWDKKEQAYSLCDFDIASCAFASE